MLWTFFFFCAKMQRLKDKVKGVLGEHYDSEVAPARHPSNASGRKRQNEESAKGRPAGNEALTLFTSIGLSIQENLYTS